MHVRVSMGTTINNQHKYKAKRQRNSNIFALRCKRDTCSFARLCIVFVCV